MGRLLRRFARWLTLAPLAAVVVGTLLAPQAAQAQCSILPAPTISSVTGGVRKLTVNWNALTTGQSSVSGWQLNYRKTEAGSTERSKLISDGSARSATITGLEAGATYRVTLNASQSGNNCPPGAASEPKTGTVSAAAKTVTLSATSTTITEGNSNQNVTITITLGEAAPSGGFFVELDFDEDKTTVDFPGSHGCNPAPPSGTDICWPSNRTIVFSGGDTEKTYTLRILGDTTDEDDETFALTGTALGSDSEPATGWSVGTLTLIIEDDDGTSATSPAIPTNFRATPGDEQVVLSWDNPGDATITNYRLRRGTTSGRDNVAWVIISNSDKDTTTHTVTGLDNDTEYSFKIRAVNNTGHGLPTAWVTATPTDSTPAAPVLTGATSTTSQRINFTWTHAGSSVGDYISGATTFWQWESSHRLKGTSSWTVNENGGPSVAGGTARRTATAALGSAYPDGAVLEVRIRAAAYNSGNSVVRGPWSNTREVTYKNDRLAALLFTGTSVQVGVNATQTYTVALTKPYAGTVSITSGDTGKATVEPSTLTFTTGNYNTAQTVTVSGVANGATTIGHKFRLTGATSDAIPDAGTVPVAVGTGTLSGKIITLSAASTSITEGNSDKTDVTITINLAEAAPTGGLNPIFLLDSGSTATRNTNFTPSTTCTSPSPADADMCWGSNGAQLSSPIPAGSTTGTWTFSILGDTTDEGDETLKWRATAGGWTAGTITLTIKDDDGTTTSAPAAPTGFSAAAGNAQVTLTWDDPEDASITEYKVRYGKKTARRNAEWATIDGSDDETTTHMVTGLDNNEEYSFKVRAVSSAGDGAATDWVDATPVAPVTIKPPTGLTIVPGPDRLYLSWTAPTDANRTGWRVQYRRREGVNWGEWSSWTAISDAAANSYDLTGLGRGYTHQVALEATGASNAASTAATAQGGTTADLTAKDAGQSPTVNEGGTVSYEVKLTSRPTGDVTVTPSSANTDLSFDPTTLTFTTANWDTYQTLTVTAAADEDTNDEGNVRVGYTASGGGYGIISASRTINIKDTTPTLQLSTNPSAVTEGTPISLTVTSDRTLIGTLPVSLTLAARSGSGFTAADIPGTLGPNTFNADFGSSPGGTTGTVSIPTSRDTDASEGAEAYRITLNDAAGYAVGTDVTADGVLNDAAAAISLSIADASAAEGDGTMSFTVTASSAPSTAVTFKYTVTAESGDTATAGSDFTAVTAAAKGSGTIAANAQTTTISATLTDDNTAESDETFTVTLSEPSGATISDAVATGTITDNDTVEPEEPEEPVVIEALKSAANLTLTPGIDRLTLDWTAPDDRNRAGWEMRYGKTTGVWSDWRLIGGADTSRHILTGLQAGTEYEVGLRPTDARSGQDSGYSVIATATTTAKPPANPPAKPANLTATASPGQVRLAWDAADDDSITGWQWQQARGSDAWGGWTDIAGATAATTSHTVTNLTNGTEYRFRIRAQNTGGAGPASDAVRATPLDARVSVPLVLTVTEGVDSSVTVPIMTTVAFGQPMQFDIRYGGTATGAADPANGDYDNDAVTSVTFPASETSRNIVIPLTDDGLDETAETIEITITPAAGSTLPAGFSLDNATTTVTITDNDASPVLVALEDISLTLGETVDLTAQATDADNDPIRYVWSRAEGETAPAVPDATDLTNARLTFEPPAAGVYTLTVTADDGNGNTDSKQLTITVQIAAPAQPTSFSAEAGIGQVMLTWDAADDDSITGYQLRYGKTAERESTAWVTLSSTGANTTHTVTGLDNGAEYSFALRAVNAGGEGIATDWLTAQPLAPGVMLSARALTIEEGSSERYTVVLEVKPAGEVTLTVGGAAGNVSVAPARLVFTAMNWATPQAFTVRVAEYADQFMDPAVTLTHTASGGGYDGAMIGNVRVTVTENPNAEREIIRRANEVNSDVLPQVIQALGSVSAVKMRMNLGGFGTPPVASANAGPFSAGGGLGGAGGMVGQSAQGSMAESMMGLTGSPAGYGTGLATAGGRFDATAPGVALRTAGFGAAQYHGTGAGTGMGMAGMSTGMGMPNGPQHPGMSMGTGVGTGMASGPQHPGLVAPTGTGMGTGAGMDMANGSPSQQQRQRPGSKLSELFNGASFLMPLGEADSASETSSEADSDSPFSGAAIWGRAEKVSFSGAENATRWDGGLWSANLGADFRVRPNLLVGAALSYARSDADTTTTNTTTNTNTNTNTGTAPADGSQSVHETELTSLSPYAAWLLDDGSSLWASAGYGTGEVRIGVGETALRSANLKVMNGAAGGNWFVSENSQWIAGGVTRLAIKGEAEFFHARSGAEDDLARLLVDTSRLRLALEGSHERRLADGSTLTPAIEAGLRYDGGDVVAGAGLEVGASLIWRNPASGFLLEFRGRHLVTHARDRDEWGVSAMLRLDPAADGLGNFLTLSPSWGGVQTGIAQLFDAQPTAAAFAPASALRPAGRLEAEYGYGFGLDRSGELAVLSPYTRLTMGAQGDRAFQFGMRYRRNSAASLEIEIGHRQPAAMLPAEPNFMLRGEYRW